VKVSPRMKMKLQKLKETRSKTRRFRALMEQRVPSREGGTCKLAIPVALVEQARVARESRRAKNVERKLVEIRAVRELAQGIATSPVLL
jgi:hypothetical protein